jgi:acyl-CoA dehydrogenase
VSATYAHLAPGELELLQRTEALARDVFAPLAAAHDPPAGGGRSEAARDAAGAVNRPLVRALAEHGLLERVLGGAGEIPALELCLIREGLARHCTEAETAFAVQGLGAHPMLANGRPAIVAEWIPRLARGEAVAGFALTEPGAGSDVAAIALRAERDGDGFRLTGEKTYISNAPEADVYSVFGRTSERGLTAFAVPGDGLGGEPLDLLSPHPIGRLSFDGVFVPGDHVLGAVDEGFRVALRTLDLFRPSVGAFAVGMAQAALDAAVEHVTERRAFGGTLSELQGVSHQLADVATAVQAARLLVHGAASAYDAGARPTTEAAAMAKLFATETAQRAIDVAIQVHGARALEHGHLLEHLYREVRATRIYEGASEVQREIIARQLFRRRASGPPRPAA